MSDTPITPTMTVREVMTRFPQTEAVFNKYGLTGCGGPKGPMEPVGFFATVHQVDADALIRELNEAIRNGVPESQSAPPAALESDIYRPFVKTALVIVVTVGCTLGAINLAAMALAGVTGSYWEAVTQAHGHAQIFGWVGLFVMGVAYHVLPRLKSTTLQGRGLAVASYWLMLAGVVLRMVAQPFATAPSFAGIVVLSALAELAGAFIFVYVIVRTLASNPSSAAFYDKYIVASAAWFWVSAMATVGISLYTVGAGLAVIPPALDVPYLHVALMGFVAMMIFGITLRTIPVFMGLRNPNERAFDLIFWILNLSILLKAGSGWADAILQGGRFEALAFLGAGLEYGALLAFVHHLGIFRRPVRRVEEEGATRSYERFIRASYFWLAIAGTMAAAYSLYQAATGLAVPHSLVGAYRHALTVGFISMMILGMAARIIPVFTGARLHSDLMLLGSFLFLNLGNGVRVISQPLADLVGGPFFVSMGVSGFVEVVALALFVYNLWRTIDSPVEEVGSARQSSAPGAITGNTIVADALARFPGALDIFVRHGFTQLQSPIGRRTLARAVTIEEAAQIKGVELEPLLRDLNLAYRESRRESAQDDDATVPEGDVRPPRPEQTGSAISPELVTMALRSCYDPEIPVNVVDLGLIHSIRIDGPTVKVEMTLTAPECPQGDEMVRQIRETLSQLPNVEDVVVDLVFDPPWTPDRMSESARRQLEVQTGRRQETRAEV